MSRQYWGKSGIVGTVTALTLGVACGNGFSGGDDCKASRTCPAAGGDQATDGGASSTPQGGEPNAAGSDADGGVGAIGAVAGAAGASGASDGACHRDADCSNGDPNDGAEVCAQGVCAAGNPPPTVVSVSPNDAMVDVEPDTSVVIEFSEPLDPKTVTASTIQVLDGATVVPGKLAYSKGTVTFTPSAALALLAPYNVTVTTGVTDEDGAALVTPYTSGFSIRDGAWQTINAVRDQVVRLSDTLPISSAGNALLFWGGSATAYCPVSARWFLRGAAATPTKALSTEGQADCNISSSGNAAGVGVVNWAEPDLNNGADVQQFRAGAWQASPARVPKNFASYNSNPAVAPNGVVTFFVHSDGETQAWMTDESGKWPASGDVIASDADQSRTSAAFDAEGNGLALWRAKDPTHSKLERIVASRFTSASGRWAVASDLPGSGSVTTPGSNQRGVPVVAMDAKGDAMALWVNRSSGSMMASRFIQATGWGDPESISGGLTVELLGDSEPRGVPGLAFDGTAFVAAWTAQEAGQRYTYTARYDLQTGWSVYEKQQTAAADGTSAARMPDLVSDGRGHSLLVFVKGTPPTFTLEYQRYVDGAWSAIKQVSGGTFTNPYFENDGDLPLSMSANGLAALAWGEVDESGYIGTIRLASFY